MPKAAADPGPEYVDEHHQRIAEFAAEYFADDPEEAETFVDTLMERRGYQRRASWALPDQAPPGAGPAGDGAPPGGQPRRAPYFKR